MIIFFTQFVYIPQTVFTKFINTLKKLPKVFLFKNVGLSDGLNYFSLTAEKRTFPEILQKAKMDVISNEDCEKKSITKAFFYRGHVCMFQTKLWGLHGKSSHLSI